MYIIIIIVYVICTSIYVFCQMKKSNNYDFYVYQTKNSCINTICQSSLYLVKQIMRQTDFYKYIYIFYLSFEYISKDKKIITKE